MPRYFFDISGSVQRSDTTGRELDRQRDVQRKALIEAAAAAQHNAQDGEECAAVVTVRDLTGAVCFRARLVSQADTS